MRHPQRLFAIVLPLVLMSVVLVLWRANRPPRGASSDARPRGQTTPKPAVDAPGAALPSRDKRPPAFVDAELAALAAALGRRDVRPQEALLSFKDDAALQRFLARARSAGLDVIGRNDALRTVRLRVDSLTRLQQDRAEHPDDYASVTANNIFAIPQPPPKQDRPDLEQIPFRNETLAYLGATGDRSTWGRGITIAVLDTGVAVDSTFDGGRLRTLDIGLGHAPGTGRDDGHGTSVAALAGGAAGDAAGVAPGANLLSIRVTDASGRSDLFTISQAIVAAADAGANVINISLGGYSTGAALDATIAYARGRGAVIVAAAGNDQAAQLAWPAADSRVISVGAIDRAEQQVSFSNSGTSLQLTAPGYGVQTAWLDGQRAYVDGTSASAPLVSGAIAAVMAKNPHLTASQAAEVLLSSASDGGAPGADEAFGRGILNVGWAMNRHNANYVDTAVATHFYDATGNQMQFVVQNRSGRSVSGMALNIAVGNQGSTQIVPSLAPGETYLAKVPVSTMALRSAGSLTFTTKLINPIAVTDQVPANNQRTSTLAAPRP